jgi:hypothetical protein
MSHRSVFFMRAPSSRIVPRTFPRGHFSDPKQAESALTKMLKGQRDFPPDIACNLAEVMNASIDVHRRDCKLSGPWKGLSAKNLLHEGVYEFTKCLIKAAEIVVSDTPDAVHSVFLAGPAGKAWMAGTSPAMTPVKHDRKPLKLPTKTPFRFRPGLRLVCARRTNQISRKSKLAQAIRRAVVLARACKRGTAIL